MGYNVIMISLSIVFTFIGAGENHLRTVILTIKLTFSVTKQHT